MTSRTTIRKKAGEFRHKALALLMSVLLAITCLPIMPGNVEEAHAETYIGSPSWTTQTSQSWRLRLDGSGLHFDFHDGGSWVLRAACSAYDSGTQYQNSGSIGIFNGQQYVDAGVPYTITGISFQLKAKVQPGGAAVWTGVLTLNHTGGSVSLMNTVDASHPNFNASFNLGGSGFTTYTGYVPATTAYANPNVTTSPTLTATLGDTISSAGGWASGISATWGHTTANAIPSMGTIDDTSLSSGTDTDLSTDGVSFNRVGIKNHSYLIKDDHSNSSAAQYAGDSTFATTQRDIVVVAANAPDLNITYAAGATDKDGTVITPGTPYTASGDSMYSTGWTNQDLDIKLSSNDPGAYDLMMRKGGINTASFSSVTTPPLPATYTVTGYGTEAPIAGDNISAIMLGTGSHATELSPESTAQVVKIDKTMPTPAATYSALLGFVDASHDINPTPGMAESGIDATRQKIALVPTGDPAPTNYQSDFMTFAALNGSTIAPGYYDAYVWAWDNAGNNTNTQVINNQLIVSSASPTITGKLASGPNTGNPLATNTWTNQDVTVEVAPPSSITNAYSALYDGPTLEDKSAAVNTKASKTYTAETSGTTLHGVMVDATNTELSAHSSNYVVKIDKTDPTASVTFNNGTVNPGPPATPAWGFADASNDNGVVQSLVDPSKTMVAIVAPGSITPTYPSDYESIITAELPATGYYDVWSVAIDNAGNVSAPIRSYEHISRSGLDEITAKDFSWDIAKGSGTFDDDMVRMLSHVVGIPYGSNTPFPLTLITVDPGELAAIVSAINLGLKGTIHDLTFSTPGGPKKATTTVKVTLFDSGSNIPTPPTPLTQELIFANDFDWGISTGNITPDDSRILSQVVGYKLNGDKFATGDLLVDATELQDINDAIDAGKKDTTWPLTFRTDGSTGPAASVTIDVTLFDNGPIGPIPANAEHIVGNNFAWGISTGALSFAEAYFLGNINPTSATGAPFTQANVTADAGELSDINDAITAGQVGAVLPLTFTTDGSTGTAASVTINVTLYGNGPVGPIVPGVEHVVGNDFNWGISTGALDGSTSLNLSGAVATGGNGLQMDVATNVTVDAGDLAAINAAITAGQKGVTLPLKLDTNGFTGAPASTTINVTLYDNGPQGPIPAGSEHIVGNDFNWGISTGDLTESDAQILSLLAAATAQGFPMSLSSTSISAAQLDAINAAIAAGKKNTIWPLTFTTDGSTGTPASVTVNVTLFDNGPQGPIPAGSEHIVGNNFKWGIDSGNVDASIAQHLGKVLANGATGAPMAATSISIDASELAALNAAIAAGKVGTTWPLTFTTDGSTGTPASVTIYVTLFDAGHQTPVAGDPYIVANHFSRAVSAGSLDDAAAKTHSLVEALSAAGHVGDKAHISVDATELAAINASIAAADVSKPPYPLTFTYSCPVSSKTVSAVALVTLTGDKDLVVTKSVDDENPLPGDTITYTIKAKNNGNVAISGLWIKDYVPESTTFVSCDPTGVYGADAQGKDYVNWYFDSLPAGKEVVMTLTVKINECTPGTEIKNVALYQEGTPGFPANADDDPKGGETNPATSTVADSSKPAVKVLAKRIVKTGDALIPLAVVAGMGVVALGLVLVARRRTRKDEK